MPSPEKSTNGGERRGGNGGGGLVRGGEDRKERRRDRGGLVLIGGDSLPPLVSSAPSVLHLSLSLCLGSRKSSYLPFPVTGVPLCFAFAITGAWEAGHALSDYYVEGSWRVTSVEATAMASLWAGRGLRAL